MLLLAHTGITTGLVFIWDKGLNRPFPSLPGKPNIPGLNAIATAIDYRLVLVGSMLPDIIDKPIGHIFFSGTFDNNGRIIAHTLLFLLLMLSYGLFRFFKYHKNGVLVLSACSGIHLLLDEIWLTPRTLFWLIQGWHFPQTEYVDFTDWIKTVQNSASTDPAIYITESIGFIMLVIFTYYMLTRKRVHQFLLRGRIQ